MSNDYSKHSKLVYKCCNVLKVLFCSLFFTLWTLSDEIITYLKVRYYYIIVVTDDTVHSCKRKLYINAVHFYVYIQIFRVNRIVGC